MSRERGRPELPECVACGACCLSVDGSPDPFDGWAGLLPGEAEKLPPKYQKLVAENQGIGLSLKGRFCSDGSFRCVALRGSPLRQVLCSVYAVRPSVCRTFRRGGAECRAAVRDLRGSKEVE